MAGYPKANLVLVITSQAPGAIIARLVIFFNRFAKMSTHASGLNFCAFLRAEADAADDKARRLRIQAATLTQTAGLDIGKFPMCGIGLSLGSKPAHALQMTNWSQIDGGPDIHPISHLLPLLSYLLENSQPTSSHLSMNTASPSTPARSGAASPSRRRDRGSPARRSASTRATRCT